MNTLMIPHDSNNDNDISNDNNISNDNDSSNDNNDNDSSNSNLTTLPKYLERHSQVSDDMQLYQ